MLALVSIWFKATIKYKHNAIGAAGDRPGEPYVWRLTDAVARRDADLQPQRATISASS